MALPRCADQPARPHAHEPADAAAVFEPLHSEHYQLSLARVQQAVQRVRARMQEEQRALPHSHQPNAAGVPRLAELSREHALSRSDRDSGASAGTAVPGPQFRHVELPPHAGDGGSSGRWALPLADAYASSRGDYVARGQAEPAAVNGTNCSSTSISIATPLLRSTAAGGGISPQADAVAAAAGSTDDAVQLIARQLRVAQRTIGTLMATLCEHEAREAELHRVIRDQAAQLERPLTVLTAKPS